MKQTVHTSTPTINKVIIINVISENIDILIIIGLGSALIRVFLCFIYMHSHIHTVQWETNLTIKEKCLFVKVMCNMRCDFTK